ncbi:hypothetical protein PAP18089_04361 [Pandoraea apista]|uniref:Uncharacterized protein n=1 Tax=Pandoraea apista TaxID=93218 RepID=A0A5E5P9J9_9BURK|nr:hypothetical protein [Pandoraea apista]VVG73356.1 hypothetical protein PAP18089_04361 [Pandoraea apista]
MKMNENEKDQDVESECYVLTNYINGRFQKHCESGPAVVWEKTGLKEWWLYGSKVSEKVFNQWLDKKNLNEKLHSTLEKKSAVKRVKI